MATQRVFMFIPEIGEDEPILTIIFFQMGWFNHQRVKLYLPRARSSRAWPGGAWFSPIWGRWSGKKKWVENPKLSSGWFQTLQWLVPNLQWLVPCFCFCFWRLFLWKCLTLWDSFLFVNMNSFCWNSIAIQLPNCKENQETCSKPTSYLQSCIRNN